MKKKVRKRSVRVPAYGIAGTAYNPAAPMAKPATNLASMALPIQLPTKLEIPVQSGGKAVSAGAGLKGLGGAAGSAISMAPDVVSLIASPFQLSTATTGGEAAMLSVGNVAKGAAMGMQIAGPWGAAAGAAIGMIGSKGRKAEMTSFTDYDEGTLGTGLMGAFGNSKLRRERRRIKANAYNNRDAVRGTSALEADYAQEYDDMGTDTFALGGSTNSLAYVDDGELLRTPDGQISKVPERGKPTDSNLVNIPDGTRILSDSLKVPGTNKTFAQIGEKMIKNKKSKNKDIFALNAAKLNLLNNELIYNLLFELLEQVKAAKGIKPKSKLLIPAADKGLLTYGYNKDLSAFKYWDSKANNYTNDYLNWVNSITEADVKDIYNGKYGDMSTYLGKNKGYIPTVEEARRLMTDRKYGDWHKIGEKLVDTKISNANAPAPVKAPQWNLSVAAPIGNVDTANSRGKYFDYTGDPGKLNISSIPQVMTKDQRKALRKRLNQDDSQPSNFDWAGLVGSLSALPGIISDLSAKPEHFDAVYNPYASDIRDVMSGRRYDISAAMAEGKRNRAVSNYNANLFNTNTGANLAYRLQSARNYDNYVAKLRDTKNNVENQYAAEYANTMNDLGRQWVNATNLAVEQNARSRAAARNINRLGYAGIAQLGQQWAKDYNQRMRDREMLPLYDKFLSAAFPDSDLSLLRRNWSKYRK